MNMPFQLHTLHRVHLLPWSQDLLPSIIRSFFCTKFHHLLLSQSLSLWGGFILIYLLSEAFHSHLWNYIFLNEILFLFYEHFYFLHFFFFGYGPDPVGFRGYSWLYVGGCSWQYLEDHVVLWIKPGPLNTKQMLKLLCYFSCLTCTTILKIYIF